MNSKELGYAQSDLKGLVETICNARDPKGRTLEERIVDHLVGYSRRGKFVYAEPARKYVATTVKAELDDALGVKMDLDDDGETSLGTAVWKYAEKVLETVQEELFELKHREGLEREATGFLG